MSCDACRLGRVLCAPQESASAMSARELWRPCSRRTRRSRRSTSDVRSSVLGGWGGRDVARSHGRRLRAGARCRVSLRLQLGGARVRRRVPLAGRFAPPCRCDRLLCGFGAVHAAGNRIGADGARALAASLEKNRTLTTLGLEGAQLCARWLGGGGCGAVSRPAAARGRTMQSELALAAGRRARAASGPLAGRKAPPCRCDACRVGWVLCTPQTIASATTARELWRPRSRRTGRSRRSASTVRGSVLVVAGEGGRVARYHGRRLRAARTMQCELALAAGRRARAASGPLGGVPGSSLSV